MLIAHPTGHTWGHKSCCYPDAGGGFQQFEFGSLLFQNSRLIFTSVHGHATLSPLLALVGLTARAPAARPLFADMTLDLFTRPGLPEFLDDTKFLSLLWALREVEVARVLLFQAAGTPLHSPHLRCAGAPVAQTPLSVTADHTWFNSVCHLVRSNGSVVRATIREYHVYKYHSGFKCVYSAEGGRHMAKIVSALMLVVVHSKWTAADILSEEETDCEHHQINSQRSCIGTVQLTVGGSHAAMINHTVSREVADALKILANTLESVVNF